MRVTSIQKLTCDSVLPLPLAATSIQAGFPSPADDYLEDTLDLNEHLISHPASTFFVRVQGDSMNDANIHSGDILIVDKSLDAKPGDVVIAQLDGEFTVKTLQMEKGKPVLVAANPDYPKILLQADSLIWGVVTHSIKKHR
jgi:DNA polymerase V